MTFLQSKFHIGYIGRYESETSLEKPRVLWGLTGCEDAGADAALGLLFASLVAVFSVSSTADMYATGVIKPLEHISTFNRSEELSSVSAGSGMMNSPVLSAAG